jgi:hypothetical protein
VSNPWDQPKQTQSSSPGFAIIIAMVAMFLIGNYWKPIDWQFGRQDGDKQEQVDPAPVALDGVSIVCVVENRTMSADETLFFRDKEEFAKKNNLRMILRLDKDLPASEPYVAEATRKSIEVPFAAYVKDKKIIKVVSLPKTKEELLK